MLFVVVACISKLDAVPIVAVLVAGNVAMNWIQFALPSFRKAYTQSVSLVTVSMGIAFNF